MFSKDMPQFQAFELPKWEVLTPHTLQKISMKSLLVQQEEALKTSAISTTKMLELINKIIFDCMDTHEAPFDTMENFMKSLTLADREALIYGLVVASYGEEQDFNVTCSVCSKTFTEKANLTQNVDIKIYQDKGAIIQKKVDVELPISKAIATLQMPTLWDEYIFANSKGVSPDVLRKADDYLTVKTLKILAKDEKEPEKTKYLIIDNVFEIYAYMRTMSARDRKTIYKEWNTVFGDCGVRVHIPTLCPHCGNRGEMFINMVNELFRLSQ